ncbi:MAG TPA: DUF2272 domain-containing protein [Blastocatellia bacterium]|nr:DUF2272 domain-containing protein [Blastocatellia bacterium]
MNLRINSALANLRATPDTSQDPLGQMPAGHPVVALAEPEGSWRRCQTIIDDDTRDGFIHISLLRPEISPEVDRLAELAGAEYKRFLFGKRKETDPASRERIANYWLSFQNTAEPVSEPWSAAFISFIVKNTGLEKSFKFSGRHTTYLSDSKRARLASDTSRAYWAVRLGERNLVIGDMIAAYRTGGDCGLTVRTYDSLPGDFCAHTDLVVAIRDGNAITLGGNVSDSVNSKEVPLTPEGRVSEGSKRIAIMARNF